MTNTVFGQVVEGSAVLEKLEEGDEIQSIEIKNKRPRPYKVNKIQ
jgi:cyclophilin family peptidyl-prolyl cis-trans isomerase